jgi:hypothetical protein
VGKYCALQVAVIALHEEEMERDLQQRMGIPLLELSPANMAARAFLMV